MDEIVFDENGYVVEPKQQNQEYEASFFLLITQDVLFNKDLTDFQKLLYAAITGLCKKEGYCWASNAYFAKLFGKGHSQVEAGIKKLEDLGFIKREIVYKRKEDKNGNIIVTKQIAYRKIFVTINPVNQNRGILENQEGGILKNQEEIYNINNNTLLLHNNGENENDVVNDNLADGELAHISKTAPAAPKRGGLAPLINEINNRYREKYPDLANILDNYIHSFIGRRRLPTLDKWKNMLNDLERYSSVRLIGADGKKFKPNYAIQIVEKALTGKDGQPFTEFDDMFGYGKDGKTSIVMEPQFNLNQEFKKGY